MTVDREAAGPAGAEAEHLERGRLGLVDVVSQSVGFMGPVFTVALVLTLVVGAGAAGQGAGAATPIAIILAWIGMTAIGWVIAKYATRIHAAGSLYDYVSAGLGQHVGAVAGYLYYGAIAALGSAATIAIGGITSDFLQSAYGIGIPYWVIDVIVIVLLAVVLTLGVALSTRAQLALAGISFVIVLVFLVSVIVRGGQHGNSAAPFNPASSVDGWAGIIFGTIYGILSFSGFESAANLAEETREPQRSIPRAIFLSLFIVGAFYVVCSYAQDIGFGLDGRAWAGQQTPLFALGAEAAFGNDVLAQVLQIVVILDILAVILGCSVAVTRGAFAMARDRRIPHALSRTHARRGAPTSAIAALLVLYVVAVAVTRLGHGVLELDGAPEYIPIFGWLAGLGGLSLAVVYGLVSLGALRGLRGFENPWLYVPASIIGVVVAGGAVWGSMYKISGPSSTWIWFVLAVVVLGGASVLWQTARGTFVRPASMGAPRETPAVALSGDRA
jgi:amino acid transporter